jgi:hypothetical protein
LDAMPESVARELLEGPLGEQIPYQATEGWGQKRARKRGG